MLQKIIYYANTHINHHKTKHDKKRSEQKNIFISIKKPLAVLFYSLLSVFLITVFGGTIVFWHFEKNLPEPRSELLLSAPQSTQILDRNGEFLYEAHGDIKRTPVPLDEIPMVLRNATIAIEDKNFYHHFGFDPGAILRAALINFRHNETRQGASTITQQLSRVSFLSNEKTFSRKIKELILSIKIEYRYSKDEILEMYLNNIPYGSNAYGAEAGSNIYFGKSVRDINLREAAYLASMPKAPSFYSPYGSNANLLYERSRALIRTMQELGYITEAEANQALAEEKFEIERVPIVIKAPHFVMYILDHLTEKYGSDQVLKGGLRVYTSLDLGLQQQAEAIVSEWGKKNEEEYEAGNASLVAIDPRNGDILAMVGSRDYFQPVYGAVNVALSPRQPGSSFKPYVYAAAMEKGMNPATSILDIPTDFAAENNGVSYIPRNYTGRNYGWVSVRKALSGSLNIPAVKTLIIAGIENSIDTVERMGINTLKDRSRFGPSLVLGGAEVKLLEHTAGLAVFGNQGVKQNLSPIKKIIDSQSKTIYQQKKEDGVQAIDPQVAYLINDILSDKEARRFIFGSGRNLTLPDRQAAVKTGTTQDFRDAWTIGYTPSLSVGVWVGNNDNSPMKKGADGSVVAAPIWKEFMTNALASTTAEDFVRPEGIVELAVDRVSGKLPTKFTPSTKKEIFASFNAPKDYDDVHFQVATSTPPETTPHLSMEKTDKSL